MCESLGDYSQKSWNDAPENIRKSALDGVNFHHANLYASVSASHDNWMRDKIADGYVYGEVKNDTLKTHPCLIPYEELPIHQQAKDYVFSAICHALMTMVEGKPI